MVSRISCGAHDEMKIRFCGRGEEAMEGTTAMYGDWPFAGSQIKKARGFEYLYW